MTQHPTLWDAERDPWFTYKAIYTGVPMSDTDVKTEGPTQWINDAQEPVEFKTPREILQDSMMNLPDGPIKDAYQKAIADLEAADAVHSEAEQLPNPLDDSAQFKNAESIARVGWAAHREWERIIGDPPRPEWDQLPRSRQQELEDSCAYIANKPHLSISDQHDAWRAVRYGNSAEAERNCKDFSELKWSQQRKAWLWRHTVHAILG